MNLARTTMFFEAIDVDKHNGDVCLAFLNRYNFYY